MISMHELCKQAVSPEIQANLEDLLSKVNVVRVNWGQPMTVTSGYRSVEDHLRIYREKGIDNPPMDSKHLTGQAVDVYDPELLLTAWLKLNEPSDLWMEDGNANWVHFQTVPPRSGSRWFNP